MFTFNQKYALIDYPRGILLGAKLLFIVKLRLYSTIHHSTYSIYVLHSILFVCVRLANVIHIEIVRASQVCCYQYKIDKQIIKIELILVLADVTFQLLTCCFADFFQTIRIYYLVFTKQKK